MNKSKDILHKHLLKNGWTKEIKKESNIYNTLVDAMEEAINYSQCCNELPSNSLADWANKKNWTYNFCDNKWWQLQKSHNYIKLTTEELAKLFLKETA